MCVSLFGPEGEGVLKGQRATSACSDSSPNAHISLETLKTPNLIFDQA